MASNFDYDPAWKPEGQGSSNFDFDPNWTPPKAPEGGLIASAKQTGGQIVKSAGQLAADVLPGVDRDNALTRTGQGIIDANPTAVRSLSDIASSPWTATKEAVGNAAASMGGIVGARLLGQGITAAAPLAGPAAPLVAGIGQGISWLGPTAMAALPSYGGIREKQIADDPNNESSLGAKALAGAGAATVGLIENKFGPQDWALKALNKTGRDALAQQFAAKSLAGSIGKGMVKGAAIEGAEELVQNPVEQLAAFQDPRTAENLQETAFGGAMGALGGGVLGGGTGGLSRLAAPAQPEQIAQPAQTAIDPTAGPLSKAASMATQTPELAPLAFTPQQPTGPELETDTQTQERMRAAQFAADAMPFERPLSFEQPAQPVRQTTNEGMPFERIGPEDYDTLNPIRVGEGELLDRERPAQGQSRAPDAIGGQEQRRIGVADDGQQDQGAPERAIGGSVQPPQSAQGAQRALPSFTDQKAEIAARKSLPFANEPAAQKKADELAQKRSEPFSVIPHPALANRFAVVPMRNLRAMNEQGQAAQLAARAQAGQQGAVPRVGQGVQQSATDGIQPAAQVPAVQAQPVAEKLNRGVPKAEQLATQAQEARGQEGAADGIDNPRLRRASWRSLGADVSAALPANASRMRPQPRDFLYAASALGVDPSDAALAWNVFTNDDTPTPRRKIQNKSQKIQTQESTAQPQAQQAPTSSADVSLIDEGKTAQPQAQQGNQFGGGNKMVAQPEAQKPLSQIISDQENEIAQANARYDEVRAQLGRELAALDSKISPVRGKVAKKEAINDRARESRLANEAEVRGILDRYRPTIESHPEEIARRQESRRKTQEMKAQIAQSELARTQGTDTAPVAQAQGERNGLQEEGRRREEVAPKPKKARKPDAATAERAQRNAEELRAMSQDAGWSEIGGKLIRDANDNISRTSWIPRAEWFMAGMEPRPDVLAQHIDDAIAGKWIPVKSRRTIEGMTEWLDAQRGQPTLDEDASMYDFEESFGDVLMNADAREVAEFFDDAFDDSAQSEADAMRAMGFTEQEISSATGQTQEGARGTEAAGPRSASAGRGRDRETGEAQEEARAEGLTLDGYTNADIARQEAEQRARDEAGQQTQRDAERRAQADAERDTFALSGSDRPADVLAAQGQGGLFEQPAPKAAPTQQQIDAEAAKVPSGVQSRVKISLRGLRDIHDRLNGVMRARGKGQILAIEVRDAQEEIAKRNRTLDDFRKMASEKGIDADLALRGMGGVPDFSVFGDPAPAEQSPSDRFRAEVARRKQDIDAARSRASTGGQEGINGYFYKGGQFLPSTMAEPGKWKLNGKWVKSGRVLVGPGEYSYQPTPFSRSLFELAGGGFFTYLGDNGNIVVATDLRDHDGYPINRETMIRPGVKGVLGTQELSLGEIVDAWNSGQRWFDVNPDAETITTDKSATELSAVRRQVNKEMASIGETEKAKPVEAQPAARSEKGAASDDVPSVLRTTDPDPANQRITRAQADGFLRDFLAKFPGAPSITIVNTFAQLPATVQQEASNQGGNAGDTKGVFHRSKVYLVSGNHQTLADFEATVFHEVVGHAGVRALFGDEFVKTANRLFMQLGGQAGLVKIMQRRGMGSQASDYIKGIAEAQRKELDQIRADMAAGKPGAQRRWNDTIARFVLTEEVFAHVAEQVTDRPSMMDKMRELIGKVRQWLRDKGFAELASMGETDILFMLSKARQSLRTPAGRNGGGGVTRNGVTVSGNDLVTQDGKRLNKDDPDFGSAMRLADMLGLRQEPGVTTFRNEQSTIEVDGVQRSRLNSNGQPIHPTEEGIRNFWRFFKDSKVVDDRGRPLMVYRGGNTPFDETRVSEKFGAHFGTVEQANKAAERGVYGDVLQDGGEPSISTAYLKIENPWRYDGDVNNWDYIYDLKQAIEDARYDGTFPLTDEQYDAGVQKHGSVDKTTPWSNRKYLETPEQLRAILMDNGVDGVIYRNRYEGDGNSYIVFRPEQIKSAAGNTGAFDLNEAPITLRRAPSATQQQGQSARNKVADIFASLSGDTARTFNWWDRTIGSPYNKTKKSPEFKKVYDRAHDFIDDVSRFANEAADRARNILPHLDTWKDIGAGLNVRKAWADAKDYQAIAPAIFEGTLSNGTTGTVWSDEDLTSRFNLNEKQRGLYKEFRDAVNFSLDTLAKSEMTRIARVAKLDAADSNLSLDETLAHYVGQVDEQIARADGLVDEVRKRHAAETDAFVREFGDRLQTGRYRKAVEVMVDRQNAEIEEAEKANEGLDELRQSFTDKADRIQQLKDEGYAPLMRFGQYTVDVVMLDENGKPAKNADGEQDRPFFGMFESEAEAREAERILQEEYPDHTVTRGVLSDKSNELFKGITPETAELFAKMLGTSETEGFQAYLKQAVANRSAMKRLIQRKGMEGFSTDIPRVLASFITSNARLSSGNLHFGEMAKAVSDIPKTKGDVADEAIKLMQYIQNPQEEAAALRGLLFFNFLGGSVAAALVNTTQTLSTTLPYLNQFGARNAASAISKAMLSAASVMRKPGFDGVNDAGLRDALRRASEEGIIDPQEIHLLMAESMGNGASSLAGRVAGMVSKDLQVPVNRFTRSLTQAWGGLFSIAEKYNRHVAFMAAWDVAGKMSPEELRKAGASDRYNFAKQAVVETQFEYSKVNRPNWARGAVGATLFTFKTFMINYLEFLKRLPSREKALAVGVLFMLSGLSGAPGGDDLDDLIDAVGQKLGYNWNNKAGRHAWLMETFGKDATNFIERGVSSFLPIDVSARLGMGNIIPGTGIFKKSEADKSRDVAEFFGPAGSLAKGAFTVFDDVGTGKNFGELVRPVMPKAYNDAYQAIDVWQTGYYRDSKGRKVVEADGVDAFAKLTGFQPNAVAEPRRVEFMLAQSANMVRVMRADIHELWSRGIAEGDREKVQAAQDMLRTWNEKNRETPIRPNLQSIQQRVRAMRMSSAERLVRATPKEMRGMVSANLVAD